MSTSSAVTAPTTAPAATGLASAGEFSVRRRVSTRLLRSELGMVFRRRRNLAMFAVLAAFPILIGVAVKLSTPSGNEGPAFLGQITENGLFLGFTSLVVVLPLFLPLAVAVVSGESSAGEANLGTLRYLLVVPVSRTRLLLVKYAAVVAYGFAATLLVAAVGVVVGALLFPVGPVTLLSGSTVAFSSALVRALLVALYVGAMLAAVGAIGMFLSTLTEVPIGAMAATAIVTIICEIFDAIPQLSAIHSYLFPHWWLSFGDLLRQPILTSELYRGLLTAAIYVAIFLSLAWARFVTRDVSS